MRRRLWTRHSNASVDRRARRGFREFRRYSKRFAAGAQKETAAIFDLYSHLLTDARLRRELFAEVDKGLVAEWAVKTVVEKFAEQFASLSDSYLKERAGDLRAWGSGCFSTSTTRFKVRIPGLSALCWCR
ncbi:fused phosphoenolpyruvate-protein phosphotransferase PtsP/GAF domain [Cedecea neteri]|uniref:Fused phosphoenolpyruvate-protein phosphotransferase PtsP/GAF domain n=1 Tax=Cedecea neteri TaxID=158822 RepID=A0A2X2TBH5_9ENTR|nr:fused phosphoenolpyruvate-protein phosphotransferase PtsP/GAF domain [Cedecea neteri]